MKFPFVLLIGGGNRKWSICLSAASLTTIIPLAGSFVCLQIVRFLCRPMHNGWLSKVWFVLRFVWSWMFLSYWAYREVIRDGDWEVAPFKTMMSLRQEAVSADDNTEVEGASIISPKKESFHTRAETAATCCWLRIRMCVADRENLSRPIWFHTEDPQEP